MGSFTNTSSPAPNIKLSLRAFIQDLVNSRHQNMGFKIVSSSSNNPFSTILLDFKNPNEKVVLEVVYVNN